MWITTGALFRRRAPHPVYHSDHTWPRYTDHDPPRGVLGAVSNRLTAPALMGEICETAFCSLNDLRDAAWSRVCSLGVIIWRFSILLSFLIPLI